ncbi:hypothetical protein HZC00_02995 [Candidatus Kaiserbacteria bacterium]|nr:hypothetical protein [Candidatus Kaiserbacteria bacterium]
MHISPLHAADGSLDPEVNVRARTVIKEKFIRPDDATYTGILRGTVRNCVDVMVLDDHNHALMGFRVNEPWKGHWHPSGGGQVPGDSYHETGALHLKRDLGLIVDPARLHFVNSASFPWSTSAQGVPCHMNGILMVVHLEDIELRERSIPQKGDFAKSGFFPLTAVTGENGFHPAIALGARMIIRNKQKGRLGTIDPDLL